MNKEGMQAIIIKFNACILHKRKKYPDFYNFSCSFFYILEWEPCKNLDC